MLYLLTLKDVSNIDISSDSLDNSNKADSGEEDRLPQEEHLDKDQEEDLEGDNEKNLEGDHEEGLEEDLQKDIDGDHDDMLYPLYFQQ